MQMRRASHASHLLRWLALLAGGLLLAACATLSGPRDVEVPFSRLEAGLDKRFPIDQNVLEMFRIQLSAPQLAGLPAQERVLIKLRTAVSTPLTRQPWQGELALSSRLAIDSAQNAIVLREARVERLDVLGIDAQRGQLLQRVADFAADQLLENAVLHRFAADELRHLGTQYAPTRIQPTTDGLKIRFEPLP